MGDRTAGPAAGRKRGHQHHPRLAGTRRSNVPLDEVIAVLRGEPLPENHQNNDSATVPQHIEVQTIAQQPAEDCNRNVLSNITNNIAVDMVQTTDVDNNPIHETSALSCVDNNNHDSDVVIVPELPVSTKIRKVRSKPSQESTGTSKSSKSGTPEHKRRKKLPAVAVVDAMLISEERPPIEGAASDELDFENDPDAAEWAKLRCTSERTEVVAEREYRRQNRRCADYPGLAFGRSIFSSDTMMKFNIIRNELHNIMKTQLKRVGQRA